MFKSLEGLVTVKARLYFTQVPEIVRLLCVNCASIVRELSVYCA